MDWIVGAACSGLIAGGAYRHGSLSGSGAWAAVVVGTILYALGSPVWYGLMIGFFVSSTLLTKYKKHRKSDAESVYQKTGRRDAGQVLANGGLGTLLCVVHSIWPGADWLLTAYIGVVATVTADTWATEVGGLSKGLPRSILNGRHVPKGTSGGVSAAGWIAAALGAGFIGGLAILFAVWDKRFQQAFLPLESPVFWIPFIAMLSGWIGANADSFLGATVQAVYRCKVCGREVESVRHCGQSSIPLRGYGWVDNDSVNMVSSAVGGLLFVIAACLAGN